MQNKQLSPDNPISTRLHIFVGNFLYKCIGLFHDYDKLSPSSGHSLCVE